MIDGHVLYWNTHTFIHEQGYCRHWSCIPTALGVLTCSSIPLVEKCLQCCGARLLVAYREGAKKKILKICVCALHGLATLGTRCAVYCTCSDIFLQRPCRPLHKCQRLEVSQMGAAGGHCDLACMMFCHGVFKVLMASGFIGRRGAHRST